MTDRELSQQLKAAKTAYNWRFAPSPETAAKIRQVVMARIAETPVTPVAISRIGSTAGFLRYLIPMVSPRFAYTMAAFVLMAGSVAAAGMTRKALPGDTLYSAKLAVENSQVRLASSPVDKARVQMENAGNRLSEIRAMTNENKGETNGRVQEALTRFTRDVKEAKKSVEEAGDPLNVEAAKQEFAKKAREYAEELKAVKGGIKPNRDVGFAGIEQAEQALKEVQVQSVESL